MRFLNTLLVIVALLVVPAPSGAQPGADPSGHWQGVIDVPDMTMAIEIDLGKNERGEWIGAFAQPAQKVKGLPFRSVSIDGRTVRLVLKASAEVSTFDGTMTADGETINGTVAQGGVSAAFTLTRKGEAKFVVVPKSAAVSAAVTGTWHGRLESDGRHMRVTLTITNHSDGTATGSIVSPDGTGISIPIAMTEQGTTLNIDAVAVGATFAGIVNTTGTELAGTWRQAGVTLPLTLRRTVP
jgi:hypothetical protein